jgi:hypothetical protein
VKRSGIISIVCGLLALTAWAVGNASAGQRIVVTRPGSVSGCSVRQVVELVSRFAAAYSAANTRALEQLVAPAPTTTGDVFEQAAAGQVRFQFFSFAQLDDPAKPPVAGDHADVRPAFFRLVQRRHLHHDQLHLAVLGINRQTERGTVGFRAVFRRRADDISRAYGGPAGLADAKGGLNCRARTIYTFSLVTLKAATSPGAVLGLKSICPLPKWWSPNSSKIIGCKRN